MSQKIITIAGIMFAVLFIGIMAVLVSMINNTADESLKDSYSVIGSTELRTQYFSDGDVITGAEAISYINREDREYNVYVNTKNGSTGTYKEYSVGDKYDTSSNTIVDASRYKVRFYVSHSTSSAQRVIYLDYQG